MEGWLVLSKFFIVIYTATISVNRTNSYNLSYVVVTLLIYMALSVYTYIIEDEIKIKIIEVFILVFLFGSIVLMDNIFILLLPMNFFEVFNLFNIRQSVGVCFLFIPLFWLRNNVFNEYIVILMLTYVIVRIYNIFNSKVEKLTKENDYLREKNYLLNKSSVKDIQYGEQIKYMSQLEERNKIAQAIHDNIGHTISGSLMQLEAIKFIMDKDTIKCKDMIQNTINVLREGMDSIRATLRNIKPPVEQIGVNKLKLILAEFEVNSRIKANLYCEGDLGVVSVVYWKIINDSLKEILTNTIKYSNATEIKAKIEILNKIIKFQVKDNGIGCLNVVKGLGIKGIEERCQNVDGKVIIDGCEGFSVILLLPIQ
ncbi:histidine kinase [Clostridium sp. MB40-C1]|uniref:sensor histidine kinase n=1 Tax=Clostridium sp. MB40-C1 TaxID=3070996 RepID=UPI0027E003CA|nr:histidine kinase [Clostridium sp. MB40-C1]WMJ79465.1 histidine kinase [Clostridium sp. MB40-C1]